MDGVCRGGGSRSRRGWPDDPAGEFISEELSIRSTQWLPPLAATLLPHDKKSASAGRPPEILEAASIPCRSSRGTSSYVCIGL